MTPENKQRLIQAAGLKGPKIAAILEELYPNEDRQVEEGRKLQKKRRPRSKPKVEGEDAEG